MDAADEGCDVRDLFFCDDDFSVEGDAEVVADAGADTDDRACVSAAADTEWGVSFCPGNFTCTRSCDCVRSASLIEARR